jgi:endonuclease/exonuclease/phosphatase family metal-dependent hydrolase
MKRNHRFLKNGTRAIAALLILCAGLSAFGQEEKPTTLKVMTFNILHGATMNGDFDLDRIAKVIIDADPDLVSLQEVDFKTARAKGYDLATELGLRTKMASIFGRAMPYDGGEYGEAVLSKHTFVSTRNVPLPHSPGSEPRAALEVRVELPNGTRIAFIGTHLDHLRDATDRIAQAKAIIAAFKDNDVPTILSGDLNAVPDSQTITLLKQHWIPTSIKNAAPTFPSRKPTRKIDYIMYAPATVWRVMSTEVIQDEIASDHCAYVATLEILK